MYLLDFIDQQYPNTTNLSIIIIIPFLVIIKINHQQMISKLALRSLQLSKTCLSFPIIAHQSKIHILTYPHSYTFATITNKANWEQKPIRIDDNDVHLTEEEDSNWQVNNKNIIAEYPFIHIPISIIRNPSILEAEPSLKKDLIAFKCLSAKQPDLRLAYEQLFPDIAKYKPLQINEYTNKNLFSDYFEGRVNTIIETINTHQGSLDDRMAAMNILIYISTKNLSSDKVKELSEKQIVKQDETGVLLTAYVQLLIKHRLEYTHLLPLIHQKLEQSSNTPQLKVKIVKNIIVVPNFADHFSKKIIDTGINILTQNIESMHNYQILYTIRQLYNYTSPAAVNYCESLQKHLIKKHIEQADIDYHVPLILKVIKYSSKLRMSSQQLISFITKNMKRFQILFTRKNISKGIFFSLIFTKNKNQLSQQSVNYLKNYLLDTVKEISTVDEIDEAELVRFNKLLIKYMQLLQDGDKEHIKTQYLNNVLPRFDSSTEILFYNLLVVMRETKTAHESKQTQSKQHLQIIKNYVKIFLERCCIKNNTGEWLVKHQINAVVQIMYQVYRHDIQIEKELLPHICKFEFTTRDTINPTNISFFFYYLSKATHQKTTDIKNILVVLEPTFQAYMRKDRLNSIKIIYSIINVCSKFGFEHKFFYKSLENCLAKYLIRNPNFVIPQKDLRFIDQHLIKRGYGSRGLIQLISKSLQKPQNWAKLRGEYTEREKIFLQSLQAKSKERRNQKRSS